MTKNYESTYLCRASPPPESRATARLPAPIDGLGDDAGSAVDNASRSATGNASALPRRPKQEIGKQGHRLPALLITQPHKARLQKLEISWLGQSSRSRQRSQNSNQRRRGRNGLSYREALLRAENSQITYRVTGKIMAHGTDTDPTNHRHGADTG
jgi:hypothetical protein